MLEDAKNNTAKEQNYCIVTFSAIPTQEHWKCIFLGKLSVFSDSWEGNGLK